jgi:glycine dehydrogenase
MFAIRRETRGVEEGRAERDDNVPKNAPHTAAIRMAEAWARDDSRESAAFLLSSPK